MTRRRPAYAPPPVHSDAAHQAITSELVRCTLTGYHRPELAYTPTVRGLLVDALRAGFRWLDGRPTPARRPRA